jgi:glycogen debranching enzyme
MGHLPELFDGDLPQSAGGAIASAVNIGEILRAFVEDVQGHCPIAGGATMVLTTLVKPTENVTAGK